MHNRCTPRQRRVLALRMQHNALKCAKMRSRSTKMRCEMHELNAPLWTECRQNAKKNAENAQKCTSQKRYQFVAKTVLIPLGGTQRRPSKRHRAEPRSCWTRNASSEAAGGGIRSVRSPMARLRGRATPVRCTVAPPAHHHDWRSSDKVTFTVRVLCSNWTRISRVRAETIAHAQQVTIVSTKVARDRLSAAAGVRSGRLSKRGFGRVWTAGGRNGRHLVCTKAEAGCLGQL